MNPVQDYIDKSRKFRDLRAAYEKELSKLDSLKWQMDHAAAEAEAAWSSVRRERGWWNPDVLREG